MYSAPNLIKFAVNYSESEHVLKAHEIPKQKRKRLPYREPNDEHVARLVAKGYHRSADTLAELSDQDVVYYFLSVLRNANCALLNGALAEARRRSPDLYQSAVLPGRVASSSGSIPYYTQYAEIIHFLGLMSPPRRMGDNGADIVEKVRQRNVEQTRQLCESVGISSFATTDRGREWLKIVRFFDANPDWCAVMGAAVVEADEATLTVIEKQTLQQVRQLWRWRKMQDFYNCYTFATRCATAVHQLEVVAQQCQQVEQQYQRLVNHARGNEQLAPYMSFYVADKQLQGLTNIEVYPELLYAAVSTSFKTKRGNSVWEQFVATRPARIARDEIEQLLAIDTSSEAEDEFEEPKSSGCCSNAESWHQDQELLGDASYFSTDFSHFETDNMEPVRTESVGSPDCVPSNSGLGDITPSNPGLADVLVDWDSVVASGQSANEPNPELEFGLCDPLAENVFPRGSGSFNLESHLNDGAEKSSEKTEKSTEPGTE